MMDWTVLVLGYVAFLIVIFLHELGHFPEKIKFKLFPPSAAAMRAKYRLGGLLVNICIFLFIYYIKPESLFLQLIGVMAWAHFIVYAIMGSIMPEPKPSQVNISTYVFDDVPNGMAYVFIPLGIISYLALNNYYVPIILGVFA